MRKLLPARPRPRNRRPGAAWAAPKALGAAAGHLEGQQVGIKPLQGFGGGLLGGIGHVAEVAPAVPGRHRACRREKRSICGEAWLEVHCCQPLFCQRKRIFRRSKKGGCVAATRPGLSSPGSEVQERLSQARLPQAPLPTGSGGHGRCGPRSSEAPANSIATTASAISSEAR